MKIRCVHVSNSSSSSFIVVGETDVERAKKIRELRIKKLNKLKLKIEKELKPEK